MKSKEYIALGVIIVLLGAYLVLRNGDRSQYELPVLPEVAGKEITRIRISAPEHTLTITGSDDGWHIGENRYPADEPRVEAMLSALDELRLTALVSEAGVYDRYNLTDDKRIGVEAWIDERLVRDFDIGKTADTYQHTFVRLRNNPNVFHADSNFRNTFDQTLEGLRDKSALSFTVSEITGIDIISDEKRLTLTLENQTGETPLSQDAATGETDSQPPEKVWMKEDGPSADEDVVQGLLSQLAYLNCDGYLEGLQKEDFSEPISTITMKGRETFTLSLYEKGEEDTACPAISNQNDYPFTLDETACNRLSESLAKILDSEAGG
jgi:hypothetical protein